MGPCSRIFDIGEGSVPNYTAARVALNQMNNIFSPICM